MKLVFPVSLFRYYVTNPWLIAAFIAVLFLLLPLLIVMSGLFYPANEIWNHIVNNLLPAYLINTLILIVSVGLLSFLIGVNAAWLVSTYRFKGRGFFEYALVLPMAIPAYISGFAYAGMLDYTSPLYTFLRNNFGFETGQFLFFNVLSLPGAIIIFSMALYPYVYLISKAYFQQQSGNVAEAGASMGMSRTAVYFRLILPMARPAYAAGLSLVIMEVLNDYGLVKYFGVETFTTGIFTAWFGFGNLGAALKLSVYLMILVLALILIERFHRRKKRFASTSSVKRLNRIKISSRYGWLFFLFCLIPFMFGFIIPLSAFIYWTISAFEIISFDFVHLLINSFQLATISSLLIVTLTVFLAFVVRTYPYMIPRALVRLSTLGYAIPGAVVAIGILVITIWLDQHLNYGRTWILLTGSYVALVYAYLVRFMAVGYNSIESGNAKISTKLDQASRSLGVSKLRTLVQINIPLLQGPIIAASLLVFIDVLKELPLTLIMRPFNFDTLAVRVFEYASDERISEAAPAALVIILIGIIPVYVLSAILKQKNNDNT